MKDAWWGHGDGTVGVFGGHTDFCDSRRAWDFRSVGRGDIKFEDVIVALNDIHYTGPLSVEWEDGRMDRFHGATESCAFVKRLSFPPSAIAFDAAFDQKNRTILSFLLLSMKSLNRKLRMGMVGGGRGAFIGGVHRMAAVLDGKIELVAGAFSSDSEKSRLSGEDLNLDPARVYGSYAEMVKAEARRPLGDRIDFVSIVARNDLHYPVAKAFLEAGIHVICEKPLTFSLAEAKKLRAIVKKSGLVFGLLHNYTGYPMVKEARAFVAAGKLGKINKVIVEYPQGYAVSAFQSNKIQKITNWRTDSNCSGVSNCVGDIGTHAENLVQYITGLKIKEIAADLSTFIPGRLLDDDANMLVRYHGGAKGVLHASQISTGEENNLNIRVYGTQASLEWHQEHPNELILKYLDQPRQIQSSW
jgi:predicted dehydrogenase